jgi:signal transduction histidine kinase/ActR/RegA family two-component response regulator
MIASPIPKNESDRLKSLALYDIVDTFPEQAFDEITHLAAQICDCPISTVAIIDKDRQWFKSRVGMKVSETPRDQAFCGHTIMGRDLFVVPDAHRDHRFFDNPGVLGDPHIRFYAGAPLVNKDGYGLGSLCVIDLAPRELSPEQASALESLSRHVVLLLELRRAEKEVATLNTQLEKRVIERTEQLDTANRQLKEEIAERERVQQQMVQIQKMEAVGRLAGGVAHDFNNILVVINGYAEMLLSESPAPDAARTALLEIQKAGNRARALTRQLLAFSRRNVIEPKIIDLNATVKNMSGMLERLIREDIKFKIKQAPKLPSVRADESQLEQVIMNLVINAGDALPNGGQIELATSSVKLEQPLPFHGGEIEPNHYTILSVCDNGTGMSEDVKAKIFEPFFTTKPPGQGTGLGLATCFGIVQQSHGYIRCDSSLGTGTRFDVYLPAIHAAAIGSKATRPVSAVSGGETILLVEDDAAVRQLTAIRLRRLGYHVLEAADGLQALAMVQSNTALLVELLISDVMMPNLNGKELVERLGSLRPGIRAILMSGYADDVLGSSGKCPGVARFLQKPATLDQLSACVREALDSLPVAA